MADPCKSGLFFLAGVLLSFCLHPIFQGRRGSALSARKLMAAEEAANAEPVPTVRATGGDATHTRPSAARVRDSGRGCGGSQAQRAEAVSAPAPGALHAEPMVFCCFCVPRDSNPRLSRR